MEKKQRPRHKQGIRFSAALNGRNVKVGRPNWSWREKQGFRQKHSRPVSPEMRRRSVDATGRTSTPRSQRITSELYLKITKKDSMEYAVI